jgi:peptide-methionine (S)-S-oxide reductase
MRAGVVVPFVLVLGIAALGCRSTGSAVSEPNDAVAVPARPPTQSGGAHRAVGVDPGGVGMGTPLKAKEGHELAAFAGGCFWGVEDTFRQVPGVTATAVGYAGGHTTNPTYEDVCSHTTGHAETVLVEFDPAKVSYQGLLDVFFSNHDPTTLNRQGPDRGDQYRSAVFTFGDAQASAARDAAAKLEKKLGKKVVTQVSPIPAFYKAEDYHQQYDEKTGTHSCPINVPTGI